MKRPDPDRVISGPLGRGKHLLGQRRQPPGPIQPEPRQADQPRQPRPDDLPSDPPPSRSAVR